MEGIGNSENIKTANGEIKGQTFDEERALYGVKGVTISDCSFDGPADGESALKESRDIEVRSTYFNLRYPFWHVTGAKIIDCEMTDLCRAALWYDQGIYMENIVIGGIKALRESRDIELKGCKIKSPEFLWKCHQISMKDCELESEYALLECTDVDIDGMKMSGKYSFQYTENMTITNSEFDTKDAFWHSKNVTVVDSVVKGEYLGWYSENLKLVRCHIVGTQPLCYCKGLVLEDCTMEDTDLTFERSEVNATVKGDIVSVKNPVSGRIQADSIGEIILESEYVDPEKTEIICG